MKEKSIKHEQDTNMLGELQEESKARQSDFYQSQYDNEPQAVAPVVPRKPKRSSHVVLPGNNEIGSRNMSVDHGNIEE